jgi:predicted ArsR family transcriptional regulator
MNVQGLTIPEIAEILGISPSAAKFRLIRAGIQPKAQTGRMNFYDESVPELIREVSKGGRPKKKKDDSSSV